MNDLVVDSGANETRFCLKFDTADQAVGADGTMVCSLDKNQLLQSCGVKTSALLNAQSIVVHPLEHVGASHDTVYGLTFGHSSEVGAPNSIDTPHRGVHHDMSTGVASAFHYVHTTGAAFGDVTLPIHSEPLVDPQLPWKTALRWRADLAETPTSGPFNLMTSDNVHSGVTKVTMAGEEPAYLVTASDATGPSAMHRLLQNNEHTNFCGGKYKAGVRTEVDYNGQKAIKMTESDFTELAKQLKSSLTTNVDFDTGLSVHLTKMAGDTNPAQVLVPFTLKRQRLPLKNLEGEDITNASVTMADLSNHLAATVVTSGNGKTQSATTLTKAIFQNVDDDKKAVFTPLAQIAEDPFE